MAFIQPKTLVDNSYDDNSVGWGSSGRKLSQLQKSDGAQFVFKDVAEMTVLDLTLEYGRGLAPDNSPNFSSTILTIAPNDESLVPAHQSSLGKNFENFGVSDPGLFDPIIIRLRR